MSTPLRVIAFVSALAAAFALAWGGDRLANFHKLRREVRRESMTFLDRRRQLAEWKARGRAADLRMKMKRG